MSQLYQNLGMEEEQKVKISTLERRDPEIKDRFKEYLAEIEAKNISTPVAPAALAKHVGRISTERTEKARENGYLKLAGDKGHYLLTIEDVLTLFYLTAPDCPWRNNFNRHISRDLRRLIVEFGNNHLRT